MKTHITLEPSELDDDDHAVGIYVSVERAEPPDDPEWAVSQDLYLSPDEFQYLYHRMRVYVEQGTWSGGTVEW